MLALSSLLLLLISVLLSTAGTICFKKGVNRLPSSPHSVAGYLAVVGSALRCKEVGIGVLLYVLEGIAWLAFLSYVDLSVAFPMRSLYYVAILLASKFILQEQVTRGRWVGAAFIVCGIVIIGRG